MVIDLRVFIVCFLDSLDYVWVVELVGVDQFDLLNLVQILALVELLLGNGLGDRLSLLAPADRFVLGVGALLAACVRVPYRIPVVYGPLRPVSQCVLEEGQNLALLGNALNLLSGILHRSIDEVGILNILLLQVFRDLLAHLVLSVHVAIELFLVGRFMHEFFLL